MDVQTVSISILRRQISNYVRRVRERDGVVTITQHGRPTAVLLAHERYQMLLAELARLRALPADGLSKSNGPGGLAGLAALADDLELEDLAEQHDHYLYGTLQP